MMRTLKYRLYPTEAQQEVLNEILRLSCWLYNQSLAYRRKRWLESRYSVSYSEQAAMWRDWRNEAPDENALRLVNMTAGQQVLRRLDKAYRAFMQGKRGRPRFKNWRRFNSVNYKPGDGAGLKGDKLRMQNVGLISVKWHRRLAAGKLKNIVLLRKPSGWYVLLQVETAFSPPTPSPGDPVGVDVGIHHALALSDGVVIDSPQYLKASLARLRRLQRKVARRKKGSNRRRKAIRQFAKELEHIANQRRDWWHKVVHQMVSTYGLIAIEDLNLRFMLRNRKLSRIAHDIALGIFYEILNYKAMEAGVEVVTVNPRNTSQMCNGCGVIVQKNLTVRTHHCPDCGFTVDRDVNAALNILDIGWDASVRRKRSALAQA